jgi:hypothetical protein
LPRYSPEFWLHYLNPLHRMKRGLDKEVNGKGDREGNSRADRLSTATRGWV